MNYVNALSIILLIIFIFGILFNIISIIVILRYKKLQPINLLILNLALADIVYTSGIPMFVSNEFQQTWPFGIIGCRVFFLSDYIGMIVGVYSVVALSVERYIEVADRKKLDKYSDKFKLALAFLYIMFLWFFAVLFPLPLVLSFKVTKAYGGSLTCDTTWTDSILNGFFFTKYVFLFIIPFAIIV